MSKLVYVVVKFIFTRLYYKSLDYLLSRPGYKAFCFHRFFRLGMIATRKITSCPSPQQSYSSMNQNISSMYLTAHPSKRVDEIISPGGTARLDYTIVRESGGWMGSYSRL